MAVTRTEAGLDVAICPLCRMGTRLHWSRARDLNYFSSDKCYDYFHCVGCDVVFISSMPVNELNAIYPATYYSFDQSSGSFLVRLKQRSDIRSFRNLAANIPGEALSALDIGGGTGMQLELLRSSDSRIAKTTVIDLDTRAEATARANGHHYHRCRIEDFQCDERFHLILLMNLIEHVEDPLLVLQKVRDLLAPGGLAIVHTPNFDSLDASLFRKHFWAGLDCPRHWVIFNRESFARQCKEAGLTVRQSTYTQGAGFWAASVIGSLATVGKLKVSPEHPMNAHPLFVPLACLSAAFDTLRRPFGKPSQMLFVLERA